MISVNNAVLPKGSLILVTGANGFIASHLIEQLLSLGYKVRGTTRTASKLDSLKSKWDSKYPDQFEVAEVEDITVDGAFDQAIKGVHGVAHVASNVSFSSDYETVVRDAVESTLVALRAAAATPSVKRFVLTSSIVAIATPDSSHQKDLKVGEKDFNYKTIEIAKSLPDSDPTKGAYVYGASKTEGELAAWKFIKENNPSFEFSAVQPGFCIGEILDSKSQHGSTAGFLRNLFTGESDQVMQMIPDVDMVPVVDIAALHVGALLLPSVKSQRLIASAYSVTWNQILSIFRKKYPNKSFPKDVENPAAVYHIFDVEASLKLLKELGQDGWTPLEEALDQNVKAFA
ncbi:hypothetical protein JCM5350_007071 [Sporobolomyces pararoseus]